jgi:hypothetical protein
MLEWASSVSRSDYDDFIARAFPKQQQQIITNIEPYSWLMYTDRLYLASYTTPPTQDTLFPYPDRQPSRRSPSKRSTRAVDGPAAVSDRDRTPPYYFSIDDSLLSDISTDLLFSSTISLAHQRIRISQLCSGVRRMREVCICNRRSWEYELTYLCRPSKCCMYSRILHGSNPSLGTTSGPRSDCASRPTADALPRCRL